MVVARLPSVAYYSVALVAITYLELYYSDFQSLLDLSIYGILIHESSEACKRENLKHTLKCMYFCNTINCTRTKEMNM
jgi:hypothetical protein